jgi:ceramide glucosyltransferase
MDLVTLLGHIVSGLAGLWWLIAVLLFSFTLFGTFVQPLIQRRRASRKDQPPISIVLPVKLTHSGFEAAQSSAFEQVYPNYEILISAAETVSPALEAVEKIRRAHPQVSSQVLRSKSTVAASPKLNNLFAPFAAAQHDYVFMKDSNITLDPDTVATFVENFTKGVGLVVPVPIAAAPETYAGQIEAFLINGHARLLLTASALGLGFGVGKIMLFRRSDLERAGGMAAMSHTVGEDSAFAEGMASLGLKTVFAHRTVCQEIGWRSLREIYDRQIRWAVIRRVHEPLAFPVEPISSPLPAAIAAALAAPLIAQPFWLPAVATLGVWCALEIAVSGLKGWGLYPAMPLAFCGREILSLYVWCRAWTTNKVAWANSSFDVMIEQAGRAETSLSAGKK